jgi:hypothetical protein
VRILLTLIVWLWTWHESNRKAGNRKASVVGLSGKQVAKAGPGRGLTIVA